MGNSGRDNMKQFCFAKWDEISSYKKWFWQEERDEFNASLCHYFPYGVAIMQAIYEAIYIWRITTYKQNHNKEGSRIWPAREPPHWNESIVFASDYIPTGNIFIC